MRTSGWPLRAARARLAGEGWRHAGLALLMHRSVRVARPQLGERVEERLDVVGHGRGQLDALSRGGVVEGDAVGVERLAVDERGLAVVGPAAEQVGAGQGVAVAVEGVGDDGVADVGKVDADLVGP